MDSSIREAEEVAAVALANLPRRVSRDDQAPIASRQTAHLLEATAAVVQAACTKPSSREPWTALVDLVHDQTILASTLSRFDGAFRDFVAKGATPTKVDLKNGISIEFKSPPSPPCDPAEVTKIIGEMWESAGDVTNSDPAEFKQMQGPSHMPPDCTAEDQQAHEQRRGAMREAFEDVLEVAGRHGLEKHAFTLNLERCARAPVAPEWLTVETRQRATPAPYRVSYLLPSTLYLRLRAQIEEIHDKDARSKAEDNLRDLEKPLGEGIKKPCQSVSHTSAETGLAAYLVNSKAHEKKHFSNFSEDTALAAAESTMWSLLGLIVPKNEQTADVLTMPLALVDRPLAAWFLIFPEGHTCGPHGGRHRLSTLLAIRYSAENAFRRAMRVRYYAQLARIVAGAWDGSSLDGGKLSTHWRALARAYGYEHPLEIRAANDEHGSDLITILERFEAAYFPAPSEGLGGAQASGSQDHALRIRDWPELLRIALKGKTISIAGVNGQPFDAWIAADGLFELKRAVLQEFGRWIARAEQDKWAEVTKRVIEVGSKVDELKRASDELRPMVTVACQPAQSDYDAIKGLFNPKELKPAASRVGGFDVYHRHDFDPDDAKQCGEVMAAALLILSRTTQLPGDTFMARWKTAIAVLRDDPARQQWLDILANLKYTDSNGEIEIDSDGYRRGDAFDRIKYALHYGMSTDGPNWRLLELLVTLAHPPNIPEVVAPRCQSLVKLFEQPQRYYWQFDLRSLGTGDISRAVIYESLRDVCKELPRNAGPRPIQFTALQKENASFLECRIPAISEIKSIKAYLDALIVPTTSSGKGTRSALLGVFGVPQAYWHESEKLLELLGEVVEKDGQLLLERNDGTAGYRWSSEVGQGWVTLWWSGKVQQRTS